MGPQHFDYVMVDTPPVGLITDALLMMRHVDATLFVINTRFANKDHIKNAVETAATSKNFGFILNGVRMKKSKYYYNTNYGYGYRYAYGYGSGYGYGYGYGNSNRARARRKDGRQRPEPELLTARNGHAPHARSRSGAWDIDHPAPPQPWWRLDLKEFWHYRDLMMLLVRRDLTAQYKQTILGPLGWCCSRCSPRSPTR
jgi:hypothetical protein